MKTKRLLAFAVLSTAWAQAWASPYGDFYSRATAATLKPFALDLGGILGGSAFHSGRVLGFPGFDVRVAATLQAKPDSDDLILTGSGVKAFGLPVVQAEVGLPLRFDAIVHGLSGQGARIFGGGLRYGLHKSGVLSPLPDLAVSGFADTVDQTYFSATHYSLNAAASAHWPLIHPYLGVGLDITKVKVTSSPLPGLAGTSATARGSRLTAGADISPFPFFHVHGAYTLLHGISGFDLGAGVRF